MINLSTNFFLPIMINNLQFRLIFFTSLVQFVLLIGWANINKIIYQKTFIIHTSSIAHLCCPLHLFFVILLPNLCKITSCNKNKKSVNDGYGNLIREALCKGADLLRDNNMIRYHKERGVIINKSNIFILKENCRAWLDPVSYKSPTLFQ